LQATQQPLVSATIASYNYERYLGAAIDSLLAQTYDAVEIIVVDDASTDGSRDLILDYVRRHPGRIRHHFNDRNRGPLVTLRKAYALAQGEFIAVSGADDVSLPHRIASAVDIMRGAPNLGAVFSRAQFIDGDGNVLQHPSLEKVFNRRIDNIRWELLSGNVLCAPSALLRTSVVKSLLMNTGTPYVEDFDLWLRILDCHDIHRDDDTWVRYRQHGANFSMHETAASPLAPRYESVISIINAIRRWPLTHLFAFASADGSAGRVTEEAGALAKLARHCLDLDAIFFQRPFLGTTEAYRLALEALGRDSDCEAAQAALAAVYAQMGDTGRAAGGKTITLDAWQESYPAKLSATGAPSEHGIEEEDVSYLRWQSKKQLEDIDGQYFGEHVVQCWRHRPVIAILVTGPAADGAVERTLTSIAGQLYPPARTLIQDSASAGTSTSGDVTIVPATLPIPALSRHLGVNGNGLGDWLLMVPAGMTLQPQALFMLADYINLHPEWHAVYCDDDLLTPSGTRRRPRFKPNFDSLLLQGYDYLGPLFVSLPTLAVLADDLPAQELSACEITFRIAESLSDRAVGHISDVLFSQPEKGLSIDGRARHGEAVRSHFQRLGILATTSEGPVAGTFRTTRQAQSMPSVTMLILDRAIGNSTDAVAAIVDGTDYPDLEILVSSALAGIKLPSKARCIGTPAPADPIMSINVAAAEARGDWLLLYNAPMLPLHRDWLKQLVSLADEGCLAAGPRIVAADGRRALGTGQILGIGGTYGSATGGDEDSGIGDALCRHAVAHQVSALAPDCLLTQRSRLLAAGGLDGEMMLLEAAVTDYCLQLRASGARLAWTPQATLQRMTDAPVDKPTDAHELIAVRDRFIDRWLKALAADPFWNRNQTLVDGSGEVESELVPRWNPDFRDRLRVLALPLPPSGQAEYRVTAPLRALARSGRIQATSAFEPTAELERAPTPVELARIAPDVIYAQAIIDDVRLRSYLACARFNPGIFRIFSLDDRITDVPQYNASHRALPRDAVAERMSIALAHSNRLIVSTEPLADLYRKNIDDIRVVPNRLEKALWEAVQAPLRATGKKPRVGWAGAVQHQGDLAIITPVIEALASEVDWIFFGMIPAGCDKYVAEFHPPVKPYAAYPAKLATLSLDLALAPLEINLFNEAKSNLRLLEYGFFGWPVIASDIVPYQTDDAPVCRVANRPQAWLEAIRARIADPDAARAEGHRLRDWVRSRYLLEDWPDDWLTALSPDSGKRAQEARPATPQPPTIIVKEQTADCQGGWQPEVRDALPRILGYAQTTREHDYRAASPLRALRDAGLAHSLLVGRPDSNVVSYLPTNEVERLAPDVTYWHFIIDDLRLEGLRRYAQAFPKLRRVYSLDDRIGDLPATHPQAATFSGHLLDSRIREALRHCQRLVVTTAPLAELYGSAVESVHIVPNRLEKALWQGVTPPLGVPGRRRPRVGWAGAQQHHADLQLIAKTVAELADEVDWIFFGMMPPGCERHVREFHAAVNFRDYPSQLASLDLDIAVAPLEVNLFNEAKSNLRLLDYGYLGWPVVCTDILPYRTDDPPVTRVANTTAAWTQAIRDLAADSEAARRQGEALRQWVCRSYLLEDRISEWLRALTE
jgi:glycosyltransferase involved in cell wall biosynthesis